MLQLKDLKSLRTLIIEPTYRRLTNDHLAPLKDLKNLRTLVIDGGWESEMRLRHALACRTHSPDVGAVVGA